MSERTLDEIIYLESLAELRKCFQNKTLQATGFWAGFYKKSIRKDALTYVQASDEALCYGWTGIIIKRIDHASYKVKFNLRKTKSVWSLLNIKKFEALRKAGKVKPQGLKAFEERDRSKSEEKKMKFTAAHLKTFKANKKAWAFFTSMTASYQYYMVRWVEGAKQKETQDKRLTELIRDSAAGTKLRRTVEAMAKATPKHEPGKTPIEEAENVGAVMGAELRSVGLDTVEKLQSLGWEEAFQKLCESNPARATLGQLVSLVGAVEGIDRRKMGPSLKTQAKAFLKEMKRSFRD